MTLMREKYPPQVEFFFGGDNDNFVHACNFLSLDEDNNELISFLCSDTGVYSWSDLI